MRNNYNGRGGVGGRNLNDRPSRNSFNNRENGLYLNFFLVFKNVLFKGPDNYYGYLGHILGFN